MIIQFFKGLGTDIIAYTPDGALACIQCHKGKDPVGAYQIQLLLQAMKTYDCQAAVVVTPGEYEWPAVNIAYDDCVRLMRIDEKSGALEYAHPLRRGIQW